MATVLLADGVRERVELERTFLQRHDVTVVVTTPDPGIVEVVCRHRPDVAVLDAASPGGFGIARCRELKGDPRTRDTPVVVVTGEALADEARRSGADAVLNEPLDPRAFVDTLRRYVPVVERRSPRCGVNLRFRFSTSHGSGQAFCRSLSAHGAFLKTDFVLPLHTRMRLRFWLPGADAEMECEGVVRSAFELERGCSIRGIGVQFEGLSFAQRERLARFIDSRARHRSFLVTGGRTG